jgi:hypothetical protein
MNKQEQILSFIQTLYLSNNGSRAKNMSYMISICKMFLSKEKYILLDNKFRANDTEMKFLKIYNEIVMSSRLSGAWFNHVKKDILTIIMKSWKGEENLANT